MDRIWFVFILIFFFLFVSCSENGYFDPEKNECKHSNVYWVKSVASTCVRMGTEGYFKCPDCNKMFTDGTLQEEILKITPIPRLPHDMSTETDWNWFCNTEIHWHLCKNNKNNPSLNCTHTEDVGDHNYILYGTSGTDNIYICKVCGYMKGTPAPDKYPEAVGMELEDYSPDGEIIQDSAVKNSLTKTVEYTYSLSLTTTDTSYLPESIEWEVYYVKDSDAHYLTTESSGYKCSFNVDYSKDSPYKTKYIRVGCTLKNSYGTKYILSKEVIRPWLIY